MKVILLLSFFLFSPPNFTVAYNFRVFATSTFNSTREPTLLAVFNAAAYAVLKSSH